MAWANLLIALAAMLTGVVATFLTYATVRNQLRRRPAAPGRPPTGDSPPAPASPAPDPPAPDPPAPDPPAPDPSAPELGGGYHVFVSYAEADAAHAVRLASRLRQHGVRVFLARWIGPGLVADLEKERALLDSANGVLIFSRATMGDAAIRDEYAALLGRVRSGGRRFVPVLVEPVALPPFARIRVPLDLACEGDAYEERVRLLARALLVTGQEADS